MTDQNQTPKADNDHSRFTLPSLPPAEGLSAQNLIKDPEKDTARFTLDPQEVNPNVKAKNKSMSFSSILEQNSHKESTFWHTKMGVVWIFIFVFSILLALLIGLWMYSGGTT